MGRMLGAFDEDNSNDRPDLNKCPDCGCYFAGDRCPLCGKICPEEMRAGNRKAVKQKKAKTTHHSGRVTFVEWYHNWWFIIPMMFLLPWVGIILLFTSPHKKSHKIIAISVALLVALFPTILFGFQFFIDSLSDPVDTSLSREEYVAKCEGTSAEDYYRIPDAYYEKFVSIVLVIEGRFTDPEASAGDKYTTYYLCSAPDNDNMKFIIRDCLQGSDVQNFIPGDTVTLYGEGAGYITVYDSQYNEYEEPGIYVAYAKISD